jgi:glycosyltransferase involved in cell wall biosynthesis
MNQPKIKIAIDASKLSVYNSTGTENYTRCLVDEMLKLDKDSQYILYSAKPLSSKYLNYSNVQNVVIKWPKLWTLVGLGLALRRDKPDVFFSPASFIPPIHPRKSVVVIHGLEYERYPQGYSLFRFWHLVFSTWLSSRWAKKIITPSQSTKNDLVYLYEVNPNKIEVVYSGIPQTQSLAQDTLRADIQKLTDQKYLLWIGRKDFRKNIHGLLDSYRLIKEEIEFLDLKLVIVGQDGLGWKEVRKELRKFAWNHDVIEFGYVNEKEKEFLYQNAEMLVFPSLYEGFGFPVLEAQMYDVPVVAANTSSLPEIGGDSACVYVDPENPGEIAEGILKILHDQKLRKELVAKGRENIKRFEFSDTAKKVLSILKDV